MVYSNKFVAVVVCSNQIVREIRENGNDQVYLPFGSDYSLRFKNQHSMRAVVNVEIDGQDVLEGDQLVVSPNSTSDLKGFMVDGRVENAFRFIEKTQQIAEHRGDFIDDGFIRITWKFEKQFDDFFIQSKPYHTNKWPNKCPHFPRNPWTYGSDSLRGMNIGSSGEPMASCNTSAQASCNLDKEVQTSGNLNLTDFNKANEGITVAGKDTRQDFRTVHVGQLEDVEYSIIIHLLGKNDNNQRITKPKFTHRRIQCPSCGTRSKSHVKFCPNCGTSVKAVV